MANPSFFAQLSARCTSANTLLCVGLDPHVDDLPPHSTSEQGAQLALAFCLRIIEATRGVAACYKPNSAFFECHGYHGLKALEAVIKAVPSDIPVLLDCKRGDISTTAQAYAQFAFVAMGAGSATINAYMGYDAVEPFVSIANRAVFVLCKTSNKTASEFSAKPMQTGAALFEEVAIAAVRWNNATHNVGLVVGATDTSALKRVRALAPELWILAPGVGFQGGDVASVVAAGLRDDGLGLLPAVSRAISRAQDPKQAAEQLRNDINAAREASKRHKHAAETDVLPHQKVFFELAHACGVLKFGDFTLKSGRRSPYFFNAGMFNTGKAMHQLAACYAQTLYSSGLGYDVLFGPAYKGIPLVASVAADLFARFSVDAAFAYNRKEEKDHGEGGALVGAAIGPGTRVVILDDVITAGTAVRESITLLKAKGAIVVGLVVAIDRQEVAPGERRSAVQAVQDEFGIRVLSIVGLDSLLRWVEQSSAHKDVLARIVAYRDEYGVKA